MRRWPLVAGVIFAALTICPVVQAAHVLGLGNYEYEPGALRPHLRITEIVDGWRVDVSGYPGDAGPGEEVEFQVKLEGNPDGKPAPDVVECTIHRVSVLGKRQRVVDAMTAEHDGMGYRFRVLLADISEYEITFAFRVAETGTSTLTLPLVVGRPGSPWTILAGFGGGLALFMLGVMVVGGIRTRRWGAGASS